MSILQLNSMRVLIPCLLELIVHENQRIIKIIYLTNKLYTNYEIVLAIIPKQQDVYNIKEITCTHQDCQ